MRGEHRTEEEAQFLLPDEEGRVRKRKK